MRTRTLCLIKQGIGLGHQSTLDSLGLPARRARRKRTLTPFPGPRFPHFKQFNDRYGHLAGDAALKRIAKALQGVARRSDLVARYGSEEFAFVLADAADPSAIMDKFLDAVAGLAIPHEDSPTGRLSISGGVVVSLSATESPKQLIQASDEALYEAKLGGRDRFVVRVLPGP
ncbi:MAG: GGDEF domain-containing protein [Pseudoxanthomonas sp.]|nr:GGDEF domain-containing protein [Pseudoxanthomonas sp.]